MLLRWSRSDSNSGVAEGNADSVVDTRGLFYEVALRLNGSNEFVS